MANIGSYLSGQTIYLSDSFTGSSLDSTKWTSVTGTGATISVSGSNLTIGSGTTANADTYVQSILTCKLPVRLTFSFSLSQRIANQTFYIGLRNAAGTVFAQWEYSGTTATNGTSRVADISATQTNTETIVTTASAAIGEIELTPEGAHFRNLVANSASAMTSNRSYTDNLPDAGDTLYVFIRCLNGGTAPASNTNFIINRLVCEGFDYQKVVIAGGYGHGQQRTSIPVVVNGTPTVTISSGTVTTVSAVTNVAQISATATGTGGVTPFKFNSLAATTAVALKAGAGKIYGYTLTNTSAAVRKVNFYNVAQASVTPGTTSPTNVIVIPAGQSVSLFAGDLGINYSTAITYNVVTGITDLDNTAGAANDVIGTVYFL